MSNDYVYELNGVKIKASYYQFDGAQVSVLLKKNNDWAEAYNMRVIADDLYETLWTGLSGAGLPDEEICFFLDNFAIESSNYND